MTLGLATRPKNINKRRKIKNITGRGVYFEVKEEIAEPHGKRKLIFFEQLQFERSGCIEYRLTYYMLGYKRSRRGRWVFGQYSLVLPAVKLALLLAEARKRGWPAI